MIEAHDYHVRVRATDPKSGVLEAPLDELPQLQFSSPPEFGGPEHVWSPEHLFVAAVASCLMTTFLSIAGNSGVEVLEYTDDSTGHLQRDEKGLYSIDRIMLRPNVLISADSDVDRAIRLLDKAEKVCLIGRSIRSEVVLETSVLQAHQVGT
ncbi:MAG TPA: OsmC family protein [Acidimicrobiia bacterium]